MVANLLAALDNFKCNWNAQEVVINAHLLKKSRLKVISMKLADKTTNGPSTLFDARPIRNSSLVHSADSCRGGVRVRVSKVSRLRLGFGVELRLRLGVGLGL